MTLTTTAQAALDKLKGSAPIIAGGAVVIATALYLRKKLRKRRR